MGIICFACSRCASKLRVREQFAGKMAKCPRCGQTLLLPGEALAKRLAGAVLPATSGPHDPPTVPPQTTDKVRQSGRPDQDGGVHKRPTGMDEAAVYDFLRPPNSPTKWAGWAPTGS